MTPINAGPALAETPHHVNVSTPATAAAGHRPQRLKPRHRRLLAVAAVLLVLGAITALVLNAFNSNLVFFYTPSQVLAQEAPQGRSFRVGGLVLPGSLRREGLWVHFLVSDGAQQLPVQYQGALPDLFKEGKGVVAQGRLEQGRFVAREVLAKHDENYMPPEAAAALAQGGQPLPPGHGVQSGLSGRNEHNRGRP